MADTEQKVDKNEEVSKIWNKNLLTKTTNGTYGQFYQFRKLLAAPEEEKPDWHQHNHEYGKFDDGIERAGFKAKGAKSPELRNALGHTGDNLNAEETKAENEAENQSGKNENMETIEPEADDRMLGLPPANPESLPKAGDCGRTWIQQEPLPTPGTWWKKESPRLQRPQPPTTGYAKRFMQNECSRLWNNMEHIGGRMIDDRLQGYDRLEVDAGQEGENQQYNQDSDNYNPDNTESYEEILARYNINQ